MSQSTACLRVSHFFVFKLHAKHPHLLSWPDIDVHMGELVSDTVLTEMGRGQDGQRGGG